MVWNWAVSWGGQSEDAGARPPAGLRRWALFDPPPAETTSLRNIVHLLCSEAPGPADQGHGVQVNSTGSGRSLCLGSFIFCGLTHSPQQVHMNIGASTTRAMTFQNKFILFNSFFITVYLNIVYNYMQMFTFRSSLIVFALFTNIPTKYVSMKIN